jgi:hypothetical protein
LVEGDNVLRTKVLIETNEDFHRADKVNEALNTNILVEIMKLCKDKDDNIRELASRTLVSIANTNFGRRLLVDTK